jgi:hypothetical protein
MLAGRRTSEEEVCPVPDELLGELYRAQESCVSDLVATVRRISERSLPSTGITGVSSAHERVSHRRKL